MITRGSGEGTTGGKDWKVKIKMTRMWARGMVIVTEFVTEERARLSLEGRWVRSGEGHTEKGNEREQEKVQEVWGEVRRG